MDKRIYERPVVIEVGDVSDLTLQNVNGTHFDVQFGQPFQPNNVS